MKYLFHTLIFLSFLSLGPNALADDPPQDAAQNGLTAADVQTAVEAAAKSVNSTSMVIAVTNRKGEILAVFRQPDAPVTAIGNYSIPVDTNELAVALARTASFFSNDQAPLSSRTVRFISGVHFPPGIFFTSNADLYGIENTNRGCSFNAAYNLGKDVPPATLINGTSPGLGIITGKPDLFDKNQPPVDPIVNPGGVPIFKDGHIVGGVGVAGVPGPIAEYAAFQGAFAPGFGTGVPTPGVVVIGGIELPFVNQMTQPPGTNAGPLIGDYLQGWGPRDSSGPVPDGYLIGPRAGAALTEDDVRTIISNTIDTANQTRAVIRLPVGRRAKFVIAIADLDGQLLAVNRMPDATVFSIDVAVAKSRNVIYFSGDQRLPADLPGVPMKTAVTNRTISYGAQPFFPVGIDYTQPGPFFDLFKLDTANPCTQGFQTPSPYQNGIVFFPGSLPLYKNGVLVGGLGVSGDGVDQDDFATAAGAKGFEAPPAIRADRIVIRNVRLPYQKFPRNPTK
ncbi:MAG: heme-binding protein [Acidobacteriota bacterium]|nr:heme-binding protein [Acidobacteriota bacterium]